MTKAKALSELDFLLSGPFETAVDRLILAGKEGEVRVHKGFAAVPGVRTCLREFKGGSFLISSAFPSEMGEVDLSIDRYFIMTLGSRLRLGQPML